MTSWPIPAAGEIAERYAVGFERVFSTDPSGNPYPETFEARAPNSVARVLGVVGEETWTDLYLYQQGLAEDLMPDRAGVDFLARHAAQWGVARLAPLTSLGTLIVAGTVGTALPIGIEAIGPHGLRWVTRAAAVIPASGAVEIPAEAVVPGIASDLAAGVILPLVSPVAGLNPQAATVGAAGFSGGRDEEPVETWRSRIIRRIRERGRAGTAGDYQDWAIEAGAAAASVLPRWVGAGSVGVAIAMPGPRVPTAAELARVQAHLDDERPVTAIVVTVPVTLVSVPVAVAVSPDTIATRAAVLAALQGHFLRDAAIGRALPKSRISEAVSSASGEYAHRIDLPVGDVALGATELPTLGTVTFASGSGLPLP